MVVVDEGGLLREAVEALIPQVGHELAGVADSAALGVSLVAAARPDAVIYDMTVGISSDFDLIAAAQAAGATVIVFSYNADDALLRGYSVRPTVVHKPDLHLLEGVLRRLEVDARRGVVAEERRQRPSRELPTPPPTGLVDAAAFYEALHVAEPGDALVSVEVADESSEAVAADVRALLRQGDRLLATRGTVRVLLVGGGEDGIASFLDRLRATGVLPDASALRGTVVGAAESPLDAFERLRTGGGTVH